MTTPNPFFELREVWELAVVEDLYLPRRDTYMDRGFVAITWSPHTFHLTFWIVPVDSKPLCYSTGLPNRVVLRWGEYGLPPLSHECLVKLSALEAARGGART